MADLFDDASGGLSGGLSGGPLSGRFAKVSLERGIDAWVDGLTYSIPQALSELKPGQRVLVPLGRGNHAVHGYVIRLLDEPDVPEDKVSAIKPILSRDRQSIWLTDELVALARWIAAYYCSPLGMVLQTMLPASVKRGTGGGVETMAALAETPPHVEAPKVSDDASAAAVEQPEAAKPKAPRKLTTRQQAVLRIAEELAAKGQTWTPIKDLADLAHISTVAPVKQLAAHGRLRLEHRSVVRATVDPLLQAAEQVALEGPSEELTLMASQQRAVDRLAQSVHGEFGVFLLHGVTGSGKTEVYLRVLERVLGPGTRSVPAADSKLDGFNSPDQIGTPTRNAQPSSAPAPAPGAIVLVPEIALTPQTVRRFISRFGPDNVAVLHSGLSAAQRHTQWRRIQDGQARIVVGARSAVFAPLANLRVIIVDEEHEGSYKQDQLPRYHARDVAIKRAHLLGIPIILGSATPSLESYYNATPPDSPPPSEASSAGPRQPRYHLLSLPERVAGLKLPTVQIVDMRLQRQKRYQLTGAAGIHLLSLPLEHMLRQTMQAKAQTMLLLNRRGYANYISCPDHACGWLMNCEFCDVAMVYHKDQNLPKGGLVRCHHCQAEQLLPVLCPVCGKRVTAFGLGTQRVEEELARKFPGIRMQRMDSDTMQTARDYYETLEQFRKGELDVLLGTQMIAKGLDFPNVQLVGVISADTALNLPDFRSAERTFQLISQVAGRTGRGQHPGLVIVQSYSPSEPAIAFAAAHDYEGFAARELRLRAQVGLPPVTRMARIVVRDKDHLACAKRATALAGYLKQFDAQLGTQIRIRGPAPCAIARIAEYHRQQVELIAESAATLQKLLTEARNYRRLQSDAHMAVDVDPVSML